MLKTKTLGRRALLQQGGVAAITLAAIPAMGLLGAKTAPPADDKLADIIRRYDAEKACC